MRPSDAPSSPPFPVLEPIIFDAEMDNLYGDRDMEFFDPAVLDNSSPRPDHDSEDFLVATSGNRAITDSLTSISPSQLGLKQPYKEEDNARQTPNPPPPESLSDSPGNSSGSCSSSSSGNHLRHTSFNSTFSGPFGESPTLSKQYPPGWANMDGPLLGLDTDSNSLPRGFSIGADIESSNKAMDSAFDFEGAASSPRPLKSEPTPAESQNVSPRTQLSRPSKVPNAMSHMKSPVSCLVNVIARAGLIFHSISLNHHLLFTSKGQEKPLRPLWYQVCPGPCRMGGMDHLHLQDWRKPLVVSL
jgi:hypothetical protein